LGCARGSLETSVCETVQYELWSGGAVLRLEGLGLAMSRIVHLSSNLIHKILKMLRDESIDYGCQSFHRSHDDSHSVTVSYKLNFLVNILCSLCKSSSIVISRSVLTSPKRRELLLPRRILELPWPSISDRLYRTISPDTPQKFVPCSPDLSLRSSVRSL
jgi:hypothetical protein